MVSAAREAGSRCLLSARGETNLGLPSSDRLRRSVQTEGVAEADLKSSGVQFVLRRNDLCECGSTKKYVYTV